MLNPREVDVAIVDGDGRSCGSLRIRVLPSARLDARPAPIVDLRSVAAGAGGGGSDALEPVQLLEGEEYRYELRLDAAATSIETDRAELFEADDETGASGRLRTGLHTGVLPVEVRAGGRRVGRVGLEVRSRKLDYLRQYRWMMRDVAGTLAEVVAERFAVAEQRFAVDARTDARTMYQRFAFLRALVADDAFDAALRRVLARPDRGYVPDDELRASGEGVRACGDVARRLAGAGARVPWAAAPRHLALDSLPAVVRGGGRRETLDTLPNRWVKFALAHWRADAAAVRDALAAERPTAPVRRGAGEVAAVVDRLDAALAEPMWGDVGGLDHAPACDAVLGWRDGYRELYAAFSRYELASRLSWVGGEDVYGAGQRNVATLYEYWCFLQLARVVSAACATPLDLGRLIVPRGGGLALTLARGRQHVLSGVARHRGRGARRVRVELWFNRAFGAGGPRSPSWTRPMRPDCSLFLQAGDDARPGRESWLHFDAKYRADASGDLAGERDGVAAAAAPPSAEARADLLKMHAYRDAIRGTAGAYVLYPGTGSRTFAEHPERDALLPGLGAFGLRPSECGDAEGAPPLERFVRQAVDWIADAPSADASRRPPATSSRPSPPSGRA